MDINASIVDQRLTKLRGSLGERFADELNIRDQVKLRSAVFVYLVVKTLLDLAEDEAIDSLTEGGADFGVDAIEVSDVQDGEFTVTLFQGKYADNLEGHKNFPENGVTKAIQAVKTLFDPQKEVTVNPRLTAKLEEVRSLIQDGNLPRVRFILCNNGLPWSSQAQELIDESGLPTDMVRFEHANHDTVVTLMQSSTPVKDTLRFSGKSIVDDFNYIRVFVGKVAVTEIADLLARHGDRLLERNIRRYLGMMGNRVNEGIKATLLDEEARPNFYFYNNGLTLTCSKFDFNALQHQDHAVKVEGLQIINGGQTCKTIEATLNALNKTEKNLDQAFVLVRLYQLPDDGMDLVKTITYATNSQNPVDLRDLRSNDVIQRSLETSIKDLGYVYRRQRYEDSVKQMEITSATAAEAVLSVWRRKPQQAKFRTREHFGKFYPLIFTPSLNGAQVIIATLLFRAAENYRKRPPASAPPFAPYAGPFLAMLMGDNLLKDLGCGSENLSHRNFEQALELVTQKGEEYLNRSVARLNRAVDFLYGGKEVSLQQLSATFRRGDLFRYLEMGDMFFDSLFEKQNEQSPE